MKIPYKIATVITLLLCALPARGEERLTLEPVSGSAHIEVSGTSSLHDWTVTGAQINGYVKVPPQFLSAPSLDTLESLTQSHLNPELEAIIPTDSLKSGKKIMDSKMYKALGKGEHPEIRYRLKQIQTLPAEAWPSQEGNWFATVGDLTVAGVSTEISLPMNIKRTGSQQVLWSGTHKLKMTDFEIPPPTAMLGTLKTGDDVTISFTWLLGEPQDL